MPIIKGAASDFTSYQKSSAQARSFYSWRYSRVGQVVPLPSITGADARASSSSIRSASNSVASLNIATRGNGTSSGGLSQQTSRVAAGVPRYFLD